MRKFACALAVTAVAVLGAETAGAAAIISSGNLTLGVNDTGELNLDGVGLSLAGVGDAISPGCFCEGWGVAGSGQAGWANQSGGGAFNLGLISFASTASTATSTVSMGSLEVTQHYQPSASADLFEDIVTITNTSAGSVTDVYYRRVMDWDIPPTEFFEHVTVGGLPAANVVYASDNGFETAEPNAFSGGFGFDIGGCGINGNFTDCGPADHGAVFDLFFGDLDPGESIVFSIFYGGTYSEAAAVTALATVGAEVYSFGQSDGGQRTGEPGTFIWAFKGVGGVPVPEPGSAFLLVTGLLAMRASMRRRA